jgi:nucleoside-diphosphate-sugar epimerase
MSWYVEGATPGDQSGIYADATRLVQVLGLTSFTPLEEGLRRFSAWGTSVMAKGLA